MLIGHDFADVITFLGTNIKNIIFSNDSLFSKISLLVKDILETASIFID